MRHLSSVANHRFLALLSALAIGLQGGCRDRTEHSESSIARPEQVARLTTPEPVSNPAAEPCAIQFVSRLNSSGIDFIHTSGDSDIKPFPAANGGGVGVIDFDLDGLCDIYFATGNKITQQGIESSFRNRMFRNRGGVKFSDSTELTGLGHNGFSAGIAIGDYNNDGMSDIYVVCFGPNRLYENMGDGTFLDVSASSGLDDTRWGTSAAFFDFDCDGIIDIYVGNYGRWSIESNQYCGDREKGVRTFCSPTSVSPEQDGLFKNNCDGTFTDISRSAGIVEAFRTQGVLAADLNGDSYTDLYTANDLNPNSLLINSKGAEFHDHSEMSGAAYDRSGNAQAGMGITLADADRDGDWDLFVTNFENEHNTFYRRDAQGYYHDTSHTVGLAAAGLPYIAWGTMFADFDLDGWHDVVVINGHTDDNLNEIGREGDYAQPPLIWHNENGQFELISNCSGDYFKSAHPGRGLAIADLDNDIDWDVICCHQDSSPELLVNESTSGTAAAHAVQVRFVGFMVNRDAIGTVMTTTDNDAATEQITGGGSYLSSSQRAIAISLDSDDSTIGIRIVWPGGYNSSVEGLKAGRRYIVLEGARSASKSRFVEIPE